MSGFIHGIVYASDRENEGCSMNESTCALSARWAVAENARCALMSDDTLDEITLSRWHVASVSLR